MKEEFKHEEEQREAEVGKQFNETLAAKGSETMQETVIIISQKKAAANRTAEAEAASLHEAASTSSDSIKLGDNDTSKDNSTSIEKPRMDVAMETDVDRIIDSHDNEYVLSKANEDGSMSLTLDYQFVRDLTILICASAAGGLAMELLGQPTINGYFIAGSLIGPGGLDLVKEIVQVQSVAQLGVFFLLFTLGMEFSIGKLRAVREVALLGGAAQLLCFAALGGFGGRIIGSSAPIGAFLGALLGMSSTSIVVKCLSDRGRANTIPGQITIGTLVFQDCVVGLLFASMPVISSGLTSGGSNNVVELAVAILKVLSRIAFVLVVAFIATRLVLPKAARALAKNADNEVIQMVAIGFCLAAAMGTAKLGISAELGAFIAGVMVSGTEQSDSVLVLVDSVAHIFLALFISSTGLILAPRFLFHHLPLLAAGVMVIIVAKTLVIAATVMLFKYSLDVALSVGINLAQIGELAFVLLSLATGRNLIPNEVYLLMMGVCALSLLLTPFLLQASAKLCPKSKSSVHELERHNSGGLMVSFCKMQCLLGRARKTIHIFIFIPSLFSLMSFIGVWNFQC